MLKGSGRGEQSGYPAGPQQDISRRFMPLKTHREGSWKDYTGHGTAFVSALNLLYFYFQCKPDHSVPEKG